MHSTVVFQQEYLKKGNFNQKMFETMIIDREVSLG